MVNTVEINNHLVGFALYIACEYASDVEHRKKNGDVDKLKPMSTRDKIALLTPQGVIEEMQSHTDELVHQLIDFYIDPSFPWDFDQNMWANISEVENHVERFIDLINEGNLWCLVATNMAVWSERDIGDDEPGVLVDQSFFITLIERAQRTSKTVVWSHGPMQAIAGINNADCLDCFQLGNSRV